MAELIGHVAAYVTATAYLEHQRTTYSAPPAAFQVNAIIEVIWRRYARYLAGGEMLLAMAYYCLDFLAFNFSSSL
jgi:hypothetical protein